MKNNLPKVFANPVNKKISNQKDYYYGGGERNSIPVKKKLSDILNPRKFIYKKDVVITTSKGKFNKTIIGYTRTKLLTKDNQVINIDDILDIE